MSNHTSNFIAVITAGAAMMFSNSCKKPEASSSEAAEDSKGGIRATALNSAKAGESDVLFSTLDPAATGVDFVNPILKDHPSAHLYASAMGSGGIAVGDIDGDGRPDLFLTGGPVPNRLYRQVDHLKFEDITMDAGLDFGNPWSCGASMVDIDNDGDLDIYVCNYDSPNTLFINLGDSTFKEDAVSYGLHFSEAGHTPAFSDFNADGDLDLYLMTNLYYDPAGLATEPIVGMVDGKPSVLPKFQKYYGITKINRGSQPGQISVDHDTVGQADRFVRNNGDGTFSEIRHSEPNVGKANAVVWWDPNGDGLPDLFVANDFKDPDRFFMNQGDGSFKDVIKTAVPHTTWFSMGCDSADLDGDGWPDLMVADMSGTNHFKQKVGMGAMSDSAEFLNTAVPRQYMRNAVFLNTGTDKFREAAQMTGLANSDWTWTVRLSDLNNDGLVDVFLTNGMAVNLNVADSPAAEKARPGETEWAKHMRAGTEPLKEQNLAFQNKGDLKFENVSKNWGLDHVGMSYGATAADLDRDGDLELIVANLDEPVSILRNNSAEGSRVLVKLEGKVSNRQGLGATVRVKTKAGEQSRFMTLNRGYMASGEAVAHFGLNDADRIETLSVTWPGGKVQTFEDLEVNQLYTVTEPGAGAEALPVESQAPMFEPMDSTLVKVEHKETPFDDFQRQPLSPNKMSQFGPGMAWGDIDSDGDDDLYLAGAKGSAGQMFRNEGKGKFTPVSNGPWAKDLDCEEMGVLFFDADSDGDEDLYVVSGGVECSPGNKVLQDRLYLNDGAGVFSKAGEGALPEIFESGGCVSASDIDLDGDLDLFVGGRVVPGAYPSNPRSYIFRNNGGTFVDATAEVAPEFSSMGMVTGALWSDVDGDNRPDLFVTTEWSHPRWFRNEEGVLKDKSTIAGFEKLWGWWNGIAAGDVDQDGDMDYALTNFGLNTKYHPSFEKPSRIFYGDFDGSGKKRIVEAKYEDKTLYPVRGLSCSSEAMPFIRDKMGTFTKFAQSPLVDIYSPKTLGTASQYAATELEHGLLINDGNGSFEFKILPRITQIAPAFGVDFQDVDGDGFLDLFLAQNFYHPQAETGRMAGGVSQLLKGNGKGEFTPVAPKQSGLVISEDAKSVAMVDLDKDGWLDVVAGINDGALRVFRNKGAGEGMMISVELQGAKGNRTGVGSKVIAHYADGSSLTREVYAGGGYLSQGPASIAYGVPSGNAIEKIEVKWADGKVSGSPVEAGSSKVTINHP